MVLARPPVKLAMLRTKLAITTRPLRTRMLMHAEDHRGLAAPLLLEVSAARGVDATCRAQITQSAFTHVMAIQALRVGHPSIRVSCLSLVGA